MRRTFVALACLATAFGLSGSAPGASQQVVVATPQGVPGRVVLESRPPVLPIEPGASIILGRVVEAGSTTAVADAAVTLTGPALGAPGNVFTNGTPAGPRTVAADAQGHFVFRDLPPGAYQMTSRAPGYIEGAYGQARIIQIRRTLDLVRSLDLQATDRVVPATIEMFRKAGLSGRVVDEAGEPMVGIDVSVIARMTDWGGPVSQVAARTVTDDRGMYHVDVTPGDYIIGVLAATTTVPAAAVQGFLQAQAEGGATMEAFMSNVVATGALLPRGAGTRVGPFLVSQFGSRNAPVVPPTVSGPSSTFYASAYHPSSYTPSSAVVVRVGSGEERGGVDVQMRPVPARRVSGRLVGPDGAGAGLAIRLVHQDPSVMRTSPATLIDTPMAKANEDGTFTFIGIAPGSYTLTAAYAPESAQATPLWAVEQVAVGDSDVTGLQVSLQTGARITGRIVMEGGAVPAEALSGISVQARPLPGTPAAFQTRTLLDRPDQALRFTTRPLLPGAYQIVVSRIPPGWVLKSVTAAGQNLADRAFDLGPGGLSDVVVTITDRPTTLSGMVRDSSGQPGTRATVAVFPADKSLWRLPGMASRRVQTAAPARDGRFMFRGLPAGDYYVVAVDWPTADFSDGQVLTTIIPHAAKMTLLDGESRTQDLTMAVVR